jgi:hypothetical protein
VGADRGQRPLDRAGGEQRWAAVRGVLPVVPDEVGPVARTLDAEHVLGVGPASDASAGSFSTLWKYAVEPALVAAGEPRRLVHDPVVLDHLGRYRRVHRAIKPWRGYGWRGAG